MQDIEIFAPNLLKKSSIDYSKLNTNVHPMSGLDGYTKLAAFMTGKYHPIVRKYRHLATRDLLYLQAELCQLENQYNEIAKRLTLGGFYSDAAVSQYSQIASLPEPKPSERTLLHDYISSPSLAGGCGFLSRDLAGLEQPSAYAANHQQDLAILSNSYGEDDMFTKFITGPLLTFYHWFWQHKKVSMPCALAPHAFKGPLSIMQAPFNIPWLLTPRPDTAAVDLERPSVGDNQSNLHHYDDRRVEAVTNILGTIFSCIAPLVSIIVLSFVGSPNARLGLVCAFTLLFTFCLAVATKARRVEIFAATAA
ncbi:unnamed protein product [Sphagnum balticum]